MKRFISVFSIAFVVSTFVQVGCVVMAQEPREFRFLETECPSCLCWEDPAFLARLDGIEEKCEPESVAREVAALLCPGGLWVSDSQGVHCLKESAAADNGESAVKGEGWRWSGESLWLVGADDVSRLEPSSLGLVSGVERGSWSSRHPVKAGFLWGTVGAVVGAIIYHQFDDDDEGSIKRIVNRHETVVIVEPPCWPPGHCKGN